MRRYFEKTGFQGGTPRIVAVGLLALSGLLTAGPIRYAVDGSKHEQYAEPEDSLYRSPMKLLVSRDGKRLYVTCEKAGMVLEIDTEHGRVVDSVRVGSQPFDITATPDERLLLVTNRGDDNVSVIRTETFVEERTFPVGDDPHGILVDPTGRYCYVANLSTDDISVVDLRSYSEVKRNRAGNAPFECAPGVDGGFVYVSSQTSIPVPFRTPPVQELTVLETEAHTVVGRRNLPSTAIGQGCAVSPDGALVAVALEIPKNLIPETQIYQGWMVTYGFALCERGPSGRVAYCLLDEPNLYYTDPFDLVFTPDGRHLYISSSGVDVVSVVDMTKLSSVFDIKDGRIGISDSLVDVYARHLALSNEYVVARIPTARNPKGLAVSPDGGRVYVANRLSDNVQVIDTRTRHVTETIELGGPYITTLLRRGEILFNYASISFQKQMSCNTCHPEHHVDGLIYDIAIDGGMGKNLVDNRTLRGIAFTEPFKWSGLNPTLYRQEGPRAAQLFFRSHGFEKDDLEAMVKFIESLPLPENRYAPEGGSLNEFQLRGKQLFERAYTNDGRYIPVANRCITCHPPPYYTDRMTHDVGTRAPFDTDEEFDTPQLNNTYETEPFLHDGRCYTLEEIWTEHNPDDLHGVTNDMKKEQLNDLIEYLKALVPAGKGVPDFTDSSRCRDPALYPTLYGRSAETPPPAPYVGDQTCRQCHAEEYRLWLGTRHARSFVTLQTRMAMMMSPDSTEAPSPTQSLICLACHGPGASAPDSLRTCTFRFEEGVSCEACHGAGGAYAREAIMHDRKCSAASGLVMPSEEHCLECHTTPANHNPVVDGPFRYREWLNKIRHWEQQGE